MYFYGTADPDVRYLVGNNFESSHYAGEIYNFESAKGCFRREIKRILVTGGEVTMVGINYIYVFRLNAGEKLVMGETVMMEEPMEPAPQPMVAEEKIGFFSSLLKKLTGRK